MKDPSNGGDYLRAFRTAGVMPDRRDRTVRHFVHDGARHGFGQVHLLHLDVGDLHAPWIGVLIENGLQAQVDLLAMREQLVQVRAASKAGR